MDVDKIYEEKIRGKYKFPFFLKEKQTQIIENVMRGNHSVGILPTGYGIKKGLYSLVYLSPEILLKFKFWHEILVESAVYQEQICAIVIDEVHLLETWGEKFRTTFQRLGELRSHFTNVPFLLLTATCTDSILQSILRKVYIQDPIIESLCPDRPNIFLKYKSEPGMEPLVEIKWYLDEIKEKGVGADKAILYVRSVTAVGTLFRDKMGNLRDDGYKDRTKRSQNRLVGEFHGALEDHDQKKILCSFLKPESPVRLLICTVAFGLGVNIPDIRYVIHWGACDSLLQYWQEVARAGRDGQPSVAYYYAVRTSLIHVEDDMQKLCGNIKNGSAKCFRHGVLNHIIGNYEKVGHKCSGSCDKCNCSFCKCCNICQLQCECVKNK
ncbi:ATP-dependent DNA helicase RecQ-like [Mytilus edulis]|uniref:ATP-dependent DNA helicase RecQ-like n=1 Tax=Mytilus edulis TaxID=6550 RepID=UPI0039EE941A